MSSICTTVGAPGRAAKRPLPAKVHAWRPTAASSSASASAAGSKIDSHYRSVVERTGLLAGDGGFDVRVKGDTTLTGAVIASTEAAVQANRNRFDTDGTLTLANLQNEARYKASSYSVHLSTSNSSPNTTGGFQLQGNSAGIGRDSDHAASTTTAGI